MKRIIHNRKRYNFKESNLIDFYLIWNTGYIINSHINHKHYIKLSESLNILLPDRTIPNLKNKIKNTIKKNYCIYKTKIIEKFPELINKKYELIIPDKKHVKFYVKYIKEKSQINNIVDIKVNYFMKFVYNQEYLFIKWSEENFKNIFKDIDIELDNLNESCNYIKQVSLIKFPKNDWTELSKINNNLINKLQKFNLF